MNQPSQQAGHRQKKDIETNNASLTGEAPSHDKAKEIFGGAAAALVTHAFETKGLNKIDEEKLKHKAKQDAEAVAEQYTGE